MRTLTDDPSRAKEITDSELPRVNSAVTDRLDARQAMLAAEKVPPDTAAVAVETHDPSRVYDLADKLLLQCTAPAIEALPLKFREFHTLKPLPNRQKLATDAELPRYKDPITLSELARLASLRTEIVTPIAAGPNVDSSAPRLVCWSIDKLLPRRAKLLRERLLPSAVAPVTEATAIEPNVAQPST